MGAVQSSITSLYCSDLKRSCVVRAVKDEAIEKCASKKRWNINKDCNAAFGSSEITDADKGHFAPCSVAEMPVCGAPEDENNEGWLEENKSYAIGGILGLLVIGGVGYAVFKNRKKGRR
jgi:hypothetical protein